MSIFKDKVYEELDDISKLVEPFQFKINEELSQIPDEVEITLEDIKGAFSSWGWYSLNSYDVVSKVAKELGLKNVEKEARSVAQEFFEIQVKGLEEGDQVTLDLDRNYISHRIFLVKTKLAYEDNEIEGMSKNIILHTIRGNLHNNKTVNKPRLNELADLYGANDVLQDRTYRGKVNKFCNHLEKLIDDKKLDIRDFELSKKFGWWISLYVREGNLPALNNITRIKIMMHENRPIYSIQEKDCK